MNDLFNTLGASYFRRICTRVVNLCAKPHPRVCCQIYNAIANNQAIRSSNSHESMLFHSCVFQPVHVHLLTHPTHAALWARLCIFLLSPSLHWHGQSLPCLESIYFKSSVRIAFSGTTLATYTMRTVISAAIKWLVKYAQNQPGVKTIFFVASGNTIYQVVTQVDLCDGI